MSSPSSQRPFLEVGQIENAVGSRLALTQLGLASPLMVGPRYQLLRILGRGARGLVCLALDIHLHREVALKLYPAYAPGPATREVALEAQNLAKLKHPNIVGVYDFGDAALRFDRADLEPNAMAGVLAVPCFFMSMEHVRGESMRRWLARGLEDRDRVLAIFHQCGRGLAHAHEANIAHRDFKPENVMIDESGRALVVDFGLARHRTGTEPGPEVDASGVARWQPSRAVGTPEYMAPEARHGHAGARSDQYSFALSLHEALLGRLPPMTAAGVACVDPGNFPAAVAHVLQRALEPAPQDRYPSMRELLIELPTRWSEQWRWTELADETPRRSRRPVWLWAAAGVLTTVGALGLGFWSAGLFGGSSSGAAEAAGDCPAEALAGVWKFETRELWDRYVGLRNAAGYFTLELRDRGDCQLEAVLHKTGNNRGKSVYDNPPRGTITPKVVGPDERGRVELWGRWTLEDGETEPTHYELALLIDGDELRGSYLRPNPNEPNVKGTLRGARLGRARAEPLDLEEIPCAHQCRVLCAGAAATTACQETRCDSTTTRVKECGPPGADFRAPDWLEEIQDNWGTANWKPGRKIACAEMPGRLAGDWRVWERPASGDPQSWALSLRKDKDKHCTLVGEAQRESGGPHHSVRVDIHRGGLWLVYDPKDPEALRWALVGWSFAHGLGGGRRPGPLSAYHL